MTAASGAAGQFGSLMLARIGVGAGEAGCIPPAHSMIADAVPPAARVGALSFYTTGMPIGALLGLALGGWLAELLGWRSTFYIRSEEHTSELQSLMRISYAVFCLKKKKKHRHIDKSHRNI